MFLWISDEDASVTPDSGLGFKYHVHNFVNPGRPLLHDIMPPIVLANETKVEITSDSIQSAVIYNATKPSVPILPPTPHPCESFSIPPPPPADKKRTGPRRKY